MKRKLKLLVTLVLGITLMVGFNSCGKESSGGIEPTPVNPTPNNGGSGTDKPDPTKPDNKPIGDGKVKVFEQVVAVQESEITSVKSDTAAHHYTITYNNAAPEIKPGNVVVVQDGDDVHIILVTNAKVNGNTAELDGPLGDLSYVFFDTDFTLTTDLSVVENSDDKTIYMPVSSVSLSKKEKKDENDEKDKKEWNEFSVGNYKGKFSGEIGFSDGKLTGGVEFKLTDKNEEALSYSLKSNVGLSLVVNSHYSGVTTKVIKMDNNINYGAGTVTQDISFLQSAEEVTECYLDGDLSLIGSMDIKSTGGWSKKGKKEEDMLIFEDPVPKRFVFPVGEVPVVILSGLDWYWNWSVAGELGVDVNFSLETSCNSKIGVKIISDNVNDESDWELICGQDFDITPKIGVQGYVDVSANIFAYPLLWFAAYNKRLMGVGIKFKPKATVEVGCGGGFGAGADLDFQNDDFSGNAYLNCGWKATADLDVAIELGSYRKRFLGGTQKFRPLPFDWNNKDGFSLKSDGGEIKIFGLNYHTPYALTAASIISQAKTKKLNYDYTLDWDNPQKNIIDYPVKVGEPITISFRIFDRLYNDNKRLIDKHYSDFVPTWVFLRTKSQKAFFSDVFFLTEEKADYVWTPQRNDDYLEATIYGYKEKDKAIGFIHIGSVDFSFNDIKESYKGSKNIRLLTTTEKCDMTLYIDENEVGRFENTDEIILDLTDYAGYDHTFRVVTETEYACVSKTFTAHVSVPLDLHCTPVKEATYGVPSFVTAHTTVINSKITLYVDGVEKASVFSGQTLLYDVSQLPAGHTYEIKIVAKSYVEESDFKFTCTVSAPPDTPVNPSAQLPSVSGSEINNGIPNSGYAPNVGGQNLESEYNSGGDAQSVKGQNIDQYYNGGGSTPDIKGTNL